MSVSSDFIYFNLTCFINRPKNKISFKPSTILLRVILNLIFMKNFEEKAIKDMSEVVGGAIDIYLSVKIGGLFDGKKGNVEFEPDAKITIGKLAGPGDGGEGGGTIGDLVQASEPGVIFE